MTKQKKYFISWRSKITGSEGHGKPIFADKKEAQDCVDSLNARYPALKHWVGIDTGKTIQTSEK